MHLQSEASLELEIPCSGNVQSKDGELGTESAKQAIDTQHPVKRQTRQWAAWTRQEEESFFNALRLVGKDFDKITSRVQTKNKDQVRHYYYRLIRRMNKLLGPGFCLDAKNSKDTIAAMLRWWSLLEKYSCTASKLHLKPRRFKVFVEALEHQLLKDRKKSRRRRSSLAETCPSAPSATTISLLSKAPGNDARIMKVLFVDGHNVQKVGSGRSTSSLKRNVSAGCCCNKGDLSAMRNSRQRRRASNISSVSDRTDERAATYGVSLVAYAAEHLERTSTAKESCCHDPNQGTENEEFLSNLSPSNNLFQAPTYPSRCWPNIPEANGQPSGKLKLQLFPVDDATRLTLEKDAHNPHLELTLSARKKICSVLEHLNRKWSNSSIISSGELMILHYSRHENLASCKRWTHKDTVSTAADVYAAIGYPTVFRLRYGWFPCTEVMSVSFPESETQSPCTVDVLQSGVIREEHKEVAGCNGPTTPVSNQSEEPSRNKPISSIDAPTMTEHDRITAIPHDKGCNIQVSSCSTSGSLRLKEETSSRIMKNQWEDAELMKTSNGNLLSAAEWADSLTNISVGDLLTEASKAADVNYDDSPDPCPQSVAFSCDSFDAAIAAHISCSSKELLNNVSIWDGEETCDAFSFRKVHPINQDAYNSPPGASFSGQGLHDATLELHRLVEDSDVIRATESPSCERDPWDTSPGEQCQDNVEKDHCPPDLYWADSLGPLDLDASTRYHGQELILGDSLTLSSLNRLIANSLDAFQNCSFFGSDKRECVASEAVGE